MVIKLQILGSSKNDCNALGLYKRNYLVLGKALLIDVNKSAYMQGLMKKFAINLMILFIKRLQNWLSKTPPTSFVLEDLNIMGMMKNRKLSRAIQDVSWCVMYMAIDWKCSLCLFENGCVHLAFACMIEM